MERPAFRRAGSGHRMITTTTRSRPNTGAAFLLVRTIVLLSCASGHQCPKHAMPFKSVLMGLESFLLSGRALYHRHHPDASEAILGTSMRISGTVLLSARHELPCCHPDDGPAFRCHCRHAADQTAGTGRLIHPPVRQYTLLGKTCGRGKSNLRTYIIYIFL